MAGLSAAAAVSAFAWVRSVLTGASLLHFDAKAHLVVARRTIDNLYPGWLQLGSIWLPLPHILNALPAQNDFLYRTGLFASALGYLAFMLGVAALAGAIVRVTDKPWAAVAALAVPAANPGWLYLQSTPLTEPLFFGLVCGLAFFLVSWRFGGGTGSLAGAAACSGLVCLVRYEAWPVAALGMGLVLWRKRDWRTMLVAGGFGFALPILWFGLHTYLASGIFFYVIGSENLTRPRADVVRAFVLVLRGLRDAFGLPLLVAGGVGLIVEAVTDVRRRRMSCPVAWILFAPIAVTSVAYLVGHPSKARYPLLLVIGLAFVLGLAAARHWSLAAAVTVLAVTQPFFVPKPLPVLKEATRDRWDVNGRRELVEHLRRDYQGGRILVSFGSLAPVVWETQLPLREFVHEGTHSYWDHAVVDPEREVAWVMLTRGDVLDRIRQYRPGFPEGFVKVDGFNRISLYRRARDLAPRLASAMTPWRRESSIGSSPAQEREADPVMQATLQLPSSGHRALHLR